MSIYEAFFEKVLLKNPTNTNKSTEPPRSKYSASEIDPPRPIEFNLSLIR